MKIGIDCRLWDETGVGRYIRNLIHNLQALDKKNNYVLFALSKDYDQFKIQNSKFEIVSVDLRWHTLEEQIKFPSIISKENLDLMHFPYISVPIFYNKPFVVTIHDLIPYHFPTGEASTLSLPLYKLKLLGYKFVLNNAAKKARKIITVSNATKKEIVGYLNVSDDKVVVIYEGVSMNEKIKNKNEKQQLKIKNYFLYVGNAYPHKNLDRLLEALNVLTSKSLDISLVFVGKEDYFYKRLKEKILRMKLLDKVIFLQNVSDEDLANLYENALALVLPSFMEGFGLPALEAMANKCLVLASNIPSLRETCDNAALYFNPLSVKELSDKLRAVTLYTREYGRLEELRRRGVERAKLFSWQKMAKETLKIYEEIGVK